MLIVGVAWLKQLYFVPPFPLRGISDIPQTCSPSLPLGFVGLEACVCVCVRGTSYGVNRNSQSGPVFQHWARFTGTLGFCTLLTVDLSRL